MRLLPREEKFFDLFDRMAERVVLGTEVLEEVLQDYGHRNEAVAKMRDLEHQADEIVHDTMDRLKPWG